MPKRGRIVVVEDCPHLSVRSSQRDASGDTVAVVVRYTGTGTDTGKELDLAVVHVWNVRNGKLANSDSSQTPQSFSKS